MRRFAPIAVAFSVTFHVVAMLVAAIPDTSQAMDRKLWKERRTQHELSTWADRLGVDKDELEEMLWGITVVYNDSRKAIQAPVKPYLDAIGMRQSWAMFVAGTTDRDRFQVRARPCRMDASCEWKNLYTRGVEEEDFLRDVLEHPRIRSASFRWGWPSHKKRYNRGCTAIAKQAFKRFSDVVVVQCRFGMTFAPGPGEDVKDAPPPLWDRDILVNRADLGPDAEVAP